MRIYTTLTSLPAARPRTVSTLSAASALSVPDKVPATAHHLPHHASKQQAWREQCLDCDSNAMLTSPSPRQPASVLSVEPEGARNGDGEIVPVSWNEESRRRSVRATARRLVLELQVPRLNLLITG